MAAAANNKPPSKPSSTPTGSEYSEIRKLGFGGGGEVALVQHKQSGVHFAKKSIKCGSDMTLLNSGLEEARKLTMLRHPYIVSTHSFFVEECPPGRTWNLSIIMEYCALGDLAHYLHDRVLSRSGAVPEELAWRWLGQLSEAISCVHAAGLIHRDMKPQNCFVHCCKQGDPLDIKLGDFGIARTASNSDMSKLGTAQFASPEIMVSSRYSQKIDIWGIGVVMLHVLTLGAHQFGGAHYWSLAWKDESNFFSQIRSASASIGVSYSNALMDCVLSCCRVDFNARPTAVDLVNFVKSRSLPPASIPSATPCASVPTPHSSSSHDPEALEIEIKRVTKYISMIQDRMKNPRITPTKLEETRKLLDEQTKTLARLQDQQTR